MVTARSRFGIRWARVVASPLRLLCLAALLLGFVSLHAVSAEAVSGHLTGCASSPVASPVVSAPHGETGEEAEEPGVAEPGAPGHHHDDEASHSAHECVLAQPEQGPEVAAPCPALPAEGATGAAGHTPSSRPSAATAAGATPPDLHRTAVLRI
ncbi:hypothetical protein [Streptomyces botrytidirepellens]|uniref:Uncharacterized protein n=1 Tax=Streptomyces botrytidirepellens TaxID=2486417 RepID=A0A3M8WDV8_9ACTN|nr:hypothetical protein [Streptomyces botrytidirepellens]RNG28276.1 hypothetical protein EEJ42_12315 [Streptomyces botrytidirepellens]